MQRRVYRQRGVSDEAGFAARREEAQAQVVIRRIRGQHEGAVCVAELARQRQHHDFLQPLRIEDHGGGIAGESLGGKCIDVKHPHHAAHYRARKACVQLRRYPIVAPHLGVAPRWA